MKMEHGTVSQNGSTENRADAPLVAGARTGYHGGMNSPDLELVTIDPAGAPDAVIIWLHGLGADGHDFEPVVPELSVTRRHAIRFVFPTAPRRPVTVNGGMVMTAWYDITPDMGRVEDQAGIEQSGDLVGGLIDREIATGIPSHRIILAGFSQGGAIILHAGLRYRQPLGGLMALSCYLPLPQRLSGEVSPRNAFVPIFMAHGTQDPILPHGMGLGSRNLMRQHGYAVEWHEYPMGHGVCAEEIGDIDEWLTRLLERG